MRPLEINILGIIQKYGKKLKWFGQEQSSFELENEGRLLPVENADLIGRVVHGFLKKRIRCQAVDKFNLT